jgi:hypothetical protein
MKNRIELFKAERFLKLKAKKEQIKEEMLFE